MDVAAHEAEFGREIVVDANQFVAPGKRLDNGFDEEGVGATVNRVRRDERVEEHLSIGINGDIIASERHEALSLRSVWSCEYRSRSSGRALRVHRTR